MFQNDIRNGDLRIEWDGEALEPPVVDPLVTDIEGVSREWKKDVEFEVAATCHGLDRHSRPRRASTRWL